jgi:hypothetical protein
MGKSKGSSKKSPPKYRRADTGPLHDAGVRQATSEDHGQGVEVRRAAR